MTDTTPQGIRGFFGNYRYLSNFWYSPFKVKRPSGEVVSYRAVEYAYQALKAVNEHDHDMIRLADSVKEAKRLGHEIEMRPDFEEHKVELMYTLVRAKFKQNPELLKKLLATTPLYLEETNNWGDIFWGVCKGIGENYLGYILMRVRQELSD